MDIKRYALSVMIGSGTGAILGLLGGGSGGVISRMREPILQITEFESSSDRLRFIWYGGKSAMMLGGIVGIISGLLVSALALFIVPRYAFFLVAAISVILGEKLIDSVGESVIGQPGGVICGGILGSFGGYIGRYIAITYILS